LGVHRLFYCDEFSILLIHVCGLVDCFVVKDLETFIEILIDPIDTRCKLQSDELDTTPRRDYQSH